MDTRPQGTDKQGGAKKPAPRKNPNRRIRGDLAIMTVVEKSGPLKTNTSKK
jgi:hypothetical protein